MIKSKIKFNVPKDETKKGIWKYSSFLTPIEERYQLSLGEGETKEIMAEEGLILKREDENPTGSLKDRGMAYLISQQYSQGQKKLVLPSSGNAAISAAFFCELVKMNLVVFVSPKIDKQKLQKLKEKKVEVVVSEKPVSDSAKFAKEKGCFNLRPSMNKFGSEGYQTIAFEILLNQGLVEDIFIPVSSGTALVGIATGFKKIGVLPRIHVCQTSSVCPIASLFDKKFIKEEVSLAKALVARYTPLKGKVIKIARESCGTGWVVNNQEILSAQKYLNKKGIKTSEEGAVALAGWQKAKKNDWELGKSVCLLTGKRY